MIRTITENLDVREDGTIWYIHNGKQKKLSKHNAGYLRTCIDGRAQYVHRLVAMKYIPNPENKREVNHKNGIKDDNRVCNLEWNTSSENTRHAIKTGLQNHDHLRKLTMLEVEEIRKKYVPYIYSTRTLAKEYGVTRSAIYYIIQNKTYI